MMNYLRADLYRLWKSKVMLLCLGLTVFVPVILITFLWIDALGIFGIPHPDMTIGDSSLHLAASTGFIAMLLPITVSYAGVYLITRDYKEGAFKSVLVGQGARWRYLAAKIAVAAIMAVACTTLMLALFAVLPYVCYVGYRYDVPLFVLLEWLPFAIAVCFGYAVVCELLVFLFKSETPAWLAGCVFVFGFFDNALAVGLGFLAAMAPGLADVLLTLPAFLLSTQTHMVCMGANLLTQSTTTLLMTGLVPLAWAAAGTAVSYALFRRRAL